MMTKKVSVSTSLLTDRYNISRRLASQPTSHVSALATIDMGQYTWIRPREMPENSRIPVQEEALDVCSTFGRGLGLTEGGGVT